MIKKQLALKTTGNRSFVAGDGYSVAAYNPSVAGNGAPGKGNGFSVEGNGAFVAQGAPSVLATVRSLTFTGLSLPAPDLRVKATGEPLKGVFLPK